MESVKGVVGVSEWLHIPWSKQQELQQQYPIVAQLKRAYSAYFLTHHPAPCWWITATALYEEKELGALEVVQKLYLRGEPCADSCRSEGRIDSLCIMNSQCTISRALLVVNPRRKRRRRVTAIIWRFLSVRVVRVV